MARIIALIFFVLALASLSSADTLAQPIPQYGKRSGTNISIRVFGAMQNQGIYHLPRGTTLKQLLDLAKPTPRFRGRCGIRRSSGDKWVTTYVDLAADGASTILSDGDWVNCPPSIVGKRRNRPAERQPPLAAAATLVAGETQQYIRAPLLP